MQILNLWQVSYNDRTSPYSIIAPLLGIFIWCFSTWHFKRNYVIDGNVLQYFFSTTLILLVGRNSDQQIETFASSDVVTNERTKIWSILKVSVEVELIESRCNNMAVCLFVEMADSQSFQHPISLQSNLTSNYTLLQRGICD